MEITRIKLAALWTMVMLNILIADIIGFIHPGTLQNIIDGNFGVAVTPEILLLFSVFTEIPIVMIFLSLVLPVQTNRLISTVAVVLTSLFVIGGGSTTLSYYFFATIEISSMLAILWYVWKELGRQFALVIKSV
jgi:hypothetical protein